MKNHGVRFRESRGQKPSIGGFGRLALVPHALGFDAAVIAVLWCHVTAQDLGVTVGMATYVALGFAVWGIYLLDRAWDGLRGDVATGLRHRMAGRSHAAWGGIFLVIAACTALLGVPRTVLAGGAGIAVLTAGYYAVRLRGRGREESPWRAVLLGALFAGGSLIAPLAVAGFPGRGLLAWTAAATVFAANARECMHAETCGKGGKVAPFRNLFLPLSWVATAAAALRGFPGPLVALAALAVVALFRRNLHPEATAALADAAVLLVVLPSILQ
mgnify:CR=1 FL=1